MEESIVTRAIAVLGRLEGSFGDVLPRGDYFKVGNLTVRVNDLSSLTDKQKEGATFCRVEISSNKDSLIGLSLDTGNNVGLEIYSIKDSATRIEKFITDLEKLADKAEVLND